MAITEFLRPTNFTDAREMLTADAGRAPLAGGTFLARHAPATVTGLVDLSGLDLRYVTEEKGTIRIGAMTPIIDLRDCAALGPLAREAANISTEPLRAMITVGGNVMLPLRWSDLPLLLCVCDASFVVRGARARKLNADSFFSAHPRTHMKPGDILKEVCLSLPGGMKISRKKCVRAHDDIPALHVACALRPVRGMMRDVRIAYVCQRPLPVRLPSVESLLEGTTPTHALIADAGRAARDEAGKLSDMRYSHEYLSEMIEVYTRRVVSDAAGVEEGR